MALLEPRQPQPLGTPFAIVSSVSPSINQRLKPRITHGLDAVFSSRSRSEIQRPPVRLARASRLEPGSFAGSTENFDSPTTTSSSCPSRQARRGVDKILYHSTVFYFLARSPVYDEVIAELAARPVLSSIAAQ